MVIYEVNLDVDHDVFNDYYSWLMEHAKEILKFDGFQKAEIGLIEQQDEQAKKKIRVSYTIASYHDLQTYLTQHATKMRAEAINKFGNKFSANRRVITDPIILEIRNVTP